MPSGIVQFSNPTKAYSGLITPGELVAPVKSAVVVVVEVPSDGLGVVVLRARAETESIKAM